MYQTLMLLENQPIHISQEKTNIIHTFEVNKEFAALEIIYNYEPKKIEDLEYGKAVILKGLDNYKFPTDKLVAEMMEKKEF